MVSKVIKEFFITHNKREVKKIELQKISEEVKQMKEIKISNKFPPNWDIISATFPQAEAHKAVFCYGGTLYNPFGSTITPDLEIHEQKHSEQQGENPFEWWYKYCSDHNFRKEQEIEAYGTQVAYAVQKLGKSKLTDWLLDKCAEALSSDLYKIGLSFGEAKSKIRNYSKNVGKIESVTSLEFAYL